MQKDRAVSLELIPISKITVPESQEKDIPPERHQALLKSLADQGCNLIPLLVRLKENYDSESEQQYEIIRGADWCQVAKEIEIEELWAWVYEMSDEQVEIAIAEIEQLTYQLHISETPNFDHLLQQLEVSFNQKVDSLTKEIAQSMNKNEEVIKKQLKSFDQKVDSLTQKIDQSMNKNEEVIKKQLKSWQDKSIDINQIEQLKDLITSLENSINNKVETLAGKIASSTTKKTTSISTGVKMELLSKQLDDLDRQIEKKLEGMVKTVNQFSQSIQDLEDDLKVQVSAVRRHLQAMPEFDSVAEVETKTDTPSKTTTKSKSTSTTSKPKTTSTKTTTRKTKSSSQVEPEVPIDDYDTKSLRQLKKIAQERKLRGYARMKRPEILKALREADAAS
ncbi:Rho termination factor N-terminal domain-containing protein [Okeania sp.]|uniref:Rho termination factor N-terminal domain-containing protein n=1 Tax=Okeania sp. TaxID=3100323 RepID=UPI002B4B2CC2|nr:Rho termination factor N-terminal domain-containing protein [Okeania sp.]MEB3342455.1 Rho termination factor N-terminal domain-containing protein [Okeania sp.]